MAVALHGVLSQNRVSVPSRSSCRVASRRSGRHRCRHAASGEQRHPHFEASIAARRHRLREHRCGARPRGAVEPAAGLGVTQIPEPPVASAGARRHLQSRRTSSQHVGKASAATPALQLTAVRPAPGSRRSAALRLRLRRRRAAIRGRFRSSTRPSAFFDRARRCSCGVSAGR